MAARVCRLAPCRPIGLLLERGGAFQTRHERTLMVDAAQREALEHAGLIETAGLNPIHLTTVEVLANPIEAANRFFASLKAILKTAGRIEQQEILISRIEQGLQVRIGA